MVMKSAFSPQVPSEEKAMPEQAGEAKLFAQQAIRRLH
jgi:hypothetical protein